MMNPPDEQLTATVIVPAKNEARVLGRTLGALARQFDRQGRGLNPRSYEVILLVNNSSDDTAGVARQFAREQPAFALKITEGTFAEPEAHIGNVRRHLMEQACARLERTAGSNGVILSTDADTEVAPDWMAQNLREIAAGADAVGGLIRLDNQERSRLPEQIRSMQALDNRYRTLVAWLEDCHDPQPHDRWPRHQYHFGASLAVTVEAYRAVGGLPPERKLEDVAFFQALIRQDWRFRHSPLVKIRTSARLDGRTAVGLAEQLNHWESEEHAGTETPVDSVRFLELLFRSRRAFRQLWRETGSQARTGDFAKRTPVALDQVWAALECRHFGAAWQALGLEEKLRKLLAESKAPIGSVTAELEQLFIGRVTAKANSFSPADQCDTAVASLLAC